MKGVISYGTYVPYNRLQRCAITSALGAGGGTGTRAVASYDEDTTSMGLEAARNALRSVPRPTSPDALIFATADPGYLDKTNATAIHAALGLAETVAAYDFGGAARSGVGALRFALAGTGPTLVVTADVRTGLAGGADEAGGGDAAAAFVVGESDAVIAELAGASATTAEFLDRWRLPGSTSSSVWEERFGERLYVPLAQAAVTGALKQAGALAEEIDHVIVTGLHARAARTVAAELGARVDAFAPDLTAAIGNAGTAQFGLALADVLDRASPRESILAVSLADGVDVLVLRTTDASAAHRPAVTVADLVKAGNDALSYATFLTWRGQLRREPPRRQSPDRPAAPPSARNDAWKFGFVGSRCKACEGRHVPPSRVCVSCGAIDQMAPQRLAETPGTIVTYTVDRLTYSLSPPVVVAVIDFDGGGRFQGELTDVNPATLRIGDRVEMTFRRLTTVDGVHNYFWKARPIRGGQS